MPPRETFATVRYRTRLTKGPGSRAAGLAMAFKLSESAQDSWRAANASPVVALVRAGATFIDGNSSNGPVRMPGRKPPKISTPGLDKLLMSRCSWLNGCLRGGWLMREHQQVGVTNDAEMK